MGGALMLRGASYIVLALGLTAGSAAADEAVTLPSGQAVTLFEVRQEKDENALRLRYLAPALGSSETRPSFEALSADLEHLCMTEGRARLRDAQMQAPTIIISLSEELVEFGVSMPQIAQVFEAFRVENDACMLEIF